MLLRSNYRESPQATNRSSQHNKFGKLSFLPLLTVLPENLPGDVSDREIGAISSLFFKKKNKDKIAALLVFSSCFLYSFA